MTETIPPSIIDTHVHLGNICGLETQGCSSSAKVAEDNLLVLSDYHPCLSQLILSPIIPKGYLKKLIAKTQVNEIEYLSISVQQNAIVQCWLLPIEPFVSSRELFVKIAKQNNDQYIVLASVNFRVNRSQAAILESLKEQKINFKCPGIKFHPNIQNVDPCGPEARALYECAEELGMFLLIHGGKTPFLSGYQSGLSQVNKFYRIFSNYKRLKVIFAHLGQYFDEDKEILKQLNRWPNFYVETSGVNSRSIFRALRQFDQGRIFFGTDWPFCSHAQALKLLVKGIRAHTSSPTKQATLLANICSSNAKAFLAEVSKK